MNFHRKLSDHDIEQFLAGRAPAGLGGAGDLAGFVRDLQASAARDPTPEAMKRHIARAAETAREASQAVPGIGAGTPAQRSARRNQRLPHWRRKTVLSTVFASVTAKIAGVALAATVATTGALAAAGTLPAPAQNVADTVATHVGITLPAPAGHGVTATAGSSGHDSSQGQDRDVPDVTPTVTSTVTPRPEPSESPEPIGTTPATGGENHGSCVSFAAHYATTLGLTGSKKGAFVSLVAQDPTAVSAKVSANSLPDAPCLAAMAKDATAVKAAATNANGRQGNGHDGTDDSRDGAGTTSTVTPAPTGFPRDSHGRGNGHDSGSSDKPSAVPTQPSSGS